MKTQRAFASSPLADILKSELDFENENQEKAEVNSGFMERSGSPEEVQLCDNCPDLACVLDRVLQMDHQSPSS